VWERWLCTARQATATDLTTQDIDMTLCVWMHSSTGWYVLTCAAAAWQYTAFTPGAFGPPCFMAGAV
jgi:hypothetical protein